MITALDITYGSTHRFRKLYNFARESGFKVSYIEPNCSLKNEGIITFSQGPNIFGFLRGTILRFWYSLRFDYDVLIIQKFLPFTFFRPLRLSLRAKR